MYIWYHNVLIDCFFKYAKSDVISNYKELVIEVDNIEELIDDVDDYNRFNDEELCEYLLSPTLCEGLIYTQRIYD